MHPCARAVEGTSLTHGAHFCFFNNRRTLKNYYDKPELFKKLSMAPSIIFFSKKQYYPLFNSISQPKSDIFRFRAILHLLLSIQ